MTLRLKRKKPYSNLQPRSMDAVLPTREVGEVRLRVVAKAEKALAQYSRAWVLHLPRVPRILENGVQRMGSRKMQLLGNQRSGLFD